MAGLTIGIVLWPQSQPLTGVRVFRLDESSDALRQIFDPNPPHDFPFRPLPTRNIELGKGAPPRRSIVEQWLANSGHPIESLPAIEFLGILMISQLPGAEGGTMTGAHRVRHPTFTVLSEPYGTLSHDLLISDPSADTTLQVTIAEGQAVVIGVAGTPQDDPDQRHYYLLIP